MTDTESNARPVTTVETSFEILEHLKRDGELTLTEVTDRLGLAKSTVHRHLTTLTENGYVVRSGDSYRIGLKFLDFGVRARDDHVLSPVVQPKVDELATETGEKCWCITEEHGMGIHIYGASGKHPVQTYARLGQQTHLHQHAAGKAILAHLPSERVEAIVDQFGLPAKTDRTITDRAELFAELETIRERGYAFNNEESVVGLHAVGAPICDEDGVALGAISISGPANRLKGSYFESELPDLLLGATNEIEINLVFS